jgi:hypothetical protein
MNDVRLLALFVLGSGDMLVGKVLNNWVVMCLGGFAAGAALARLLYNTGRPL